MSNIVPFGKYKGKPVEAMAQDVAYCEWLSAQPWFKEKFQNIYNTIVVNNFGEPTETPEHNAWQARFTEHNFCVQFVEHVLGVATDPREVYPAMFEVKGFDVCICFKALCPQQGARRGSENCCTNSCFGTSWVLAVEIKPSLADDYPAVLRQIRKNLPYLCTDSRLSHRPYILPVLLVGNYIGQGATTEQIQTIFGDIRIVWAS